MTISNERLSEMVGAGVPCVPASPGEIVAIVQELQSRRQSPAGVDVKPMKWVDADEGMCTKWRAAALGGHYELVDFGKDDPGFAVNFHWGRPLSFWFIQGEPDEWGPTGPKIFPTLEAAKAAAQADYERRVLSALEPTPIKETASPVVPADVQGVTDEAIRWTDRHGHHYRMDNGAILRDHSTGAWVRYADYQRLSRERDAANYELAARNDAEWERLIARAEAAESRLAEAVSVMTFYARGFAPTGHDRFYEPTAVLLEDCGRRARAFLSPRTRGQT